MSEKRRPGRPDTHLSEHPFAVRLSHAMVAQMKAAAGKARTSVSEWLRRAIEVALQETR